MCVKDVRSRSVSHVYTDDSPVRDVQLDPHQSINFATACEDGSIRVRSLSEFVFSNIAL